MNAQAERTEVGEAEILRPTYSLRQLAAYALSLGAVGFGGPVALVGYMHRDLVERRKWISEAEYKEGLSLAQIMPGPLAAQVAIYLGYVHYGVTGATMVGVAFVLPSFLMVLAIGWAYVNYGGLEWMAAVFYGVGAAVIGIIGHSAHKLTRKTIGVDRLLWGIYLASAIVTITTETEMIAMFLGAGAIVWFVRVRPWRKNIAPGGVSLCLLPLGVIVPGVIPSSDHATLLQIALFFAKAGSFVFGSGLAIIPFLYSGVVKKYGWLDDRRNDPYSGCTKRASRCGL